MSLYDSETIQVGQRPDGFHGGAHSTRPAEFGNAYKYLQPLKMNGDGDAYRPWVPADGAIDAVVANARDATADIEDVVISVFGTGRGPAERVLNETNVPGITEAQARAARLASYPNFQLEEVHDQVTHEFD